MGLNVKQSQDNIVPLEQLSIIIPTYNERENLPILIERILKSLNQHNITNYEIIIVDDNSPDGTGEIAEQLAKQYKNIKVLHRPAKMGLATAFLDGVKLAKGNIVALMDADLQHPPELLPELYQAILNGYDMAIASRYIKGGGTENWSSKRKIVSKGAIILAHILFPESRKIKDITSGYFTIRKDIIQNKKLNPIGYKIMLEIVVKAKPKRIIEIPFIFKSRTKGRSKLSSKEFINYLKHLINLCIECYIAP
jgi:dolichol-phosphate mannosyltransferase